MSHYIYKNAIIEIFKNLYGFFSVNPIIFTKLVYSFLIIYNKYKDLYSGVQWLGKHSVAYFLFISYSFIYSYFCSYMQFKPNLQC